MKGSVIEKDRNLVKIGGNEWKCEENEMEIYENSRKLMQIDRNEWYCDWNG